jgi:hypothetical protein
MFQKYSELVSIISYTAQFSRKADRYGGRFQVLNRCYSSKLEHKGGGGTEMDSKIHLGEEKSIRCESVLQTETTELLENKS